VLINKLNPAVLMFPAQLAVVTVCKHLTWLLYLKNYKSDTLLLYSVLLEGSQNAIMDEKYAEWFS
jgi:hypothetical protein